MRSSILPILSDWKFKKLDKSVGASPADFFVRLVVETRPGLPVLILLNRHGMVGIAFFTDIRDFAESCSNSGGVEVAGSNPVSPTL